MKKIHILFVDNLELIVNGDFGYRINTLTQQLYIDTPTLTGMMFELAEIKLIKEDDKLVYRK